MVQNSMKERRRPFDLFIIWFATIAYGLIAIGWTAKAIGYWRGF